jgi:hypothetical protein
MTNFYERVGLLIEDDLDRLEALGFGEDMVEDNGMFDTDRLRALEQFCKSHPGYHIVTLIEEDGELIYVNRVAFANRYGYYLADGDMDETLFEVA